MRKLPIYLFALAVAALLLGGMAAAQANDCNDYLLATEYCNDYNTNCQGSILYIEG